MSDRHGEISEITTIREITVQTMGASLGSGLRRNDGHSSLLFTHSS